MLNEIRGEDSADGIQSAQEGGGDAVEAHGRHCGLRDLPLLESGEEQRGRAHAGKAAGDGHGEDDVSLLLHAAVLGRKLVAAGGPQLIAQLGLLQQDPDAHGHDHRQGDGDGHILVVGEQGAQAQRGQDGVGIRAAQGEGVGTGCLLHLGQQGVHQIQADPVEHDAGDDLIHIAVRLQEPGDGAQHRTGSNSRQQAHVPGQPEAQGAVQAGAGADDVLAGGADVEQAHLIGEQHRQAAHQQRRGLHQRVAQIPQPGRGAGIVQEVLHNGADGLSRAGGVDNQQHDVADQQAQHDAQQGCQQGLESLVPQEG